MICYMDTSVLVALCVNEPHSKSVAGWYSGCQDTLMSSVWCVTEFASAMGLKQRTGQITAQEAKTAWQNFQSLCTHDMTLLPTDGEVFHAAALLCLDTRTGMRAGDALHLASALHANVECMATLDDILARSALERKIALVGF